VETSRNTLGRSDAGFLVGKPESIRRTLLALVPRVNMKADDTRRT
jgi:hypothetical protein